MILPWIAGAPLKLHNHSRLPWAALLVAALLAIFPAVSSEAQPPTTNPAAQPSKAPQIITLHPANGVELPIRTAVPTEALAAQLNTPSARCSEENRRTADVTLSWNPVASAEAGIQRLELTKFRDGFSALRVERSDDLAATVNTVMVQAPEAGILYRWRVLTRSVDDEWLASEEGQFEVPICVWDGE